MNSLESSLGEIAKKFNLASFSEMTEEEREQFKCDSYNKTEGHLNEKDGYNCPHCKNRGDISVLIDGRETMQICRCQTIRATLQRAKKSGLGDLISDYTFDAYKADEEWQKLLKQNAIDFCNDDNAKWFFMGGQVGAGKSHLCTAIAAHYIKQHKMVRYMLWVDESKKLKAMVNDVGYQEEIDKYKKAEVLYIDDFLKTKQGEKPTSADMNLAMEIINYRMFDKSKITIISSEKRLEDMLNYDEATMSRIYQMTGKYKLSIAKNEKRNYRTRGMYEDEKN